MPSISSGPGSPFEDEEIHINRMLTAIDLAVEATLEDPGRGITRLEQEKLSYFLIEEFDIDVTYSWYLAGANTKVMGEPTPSQNRARTTEAGLMSDSGHHEDVLRYRNYLRNEQLLNDWSLKEIWYKDRFEFLEAFYEEHAPAEYLDLYLASTRIREKLRRFSRTISDGASNTTLTDFMDNEAEPVLSEQEEEKFRLLISDLHLELAQLDRLEDTVELVSMGTDVIEQVLAQLTTIDSLRPDQRDLVDEVFEYFYYTVWRYPALFISTQTATGPNRHHLVEEHANRFMNFPGEIQTTADQLRARCESNDLYPETGHHSARLNDQQMQHLHSLGRDIITAPRDTE